LNLATLDNLLWSHRVSIARIVYTIKKIILKLLKNQCSQCQRNDVYFSDCINLLFTKKEKLVKLNIGIAMEM
jgi:hypothetical protein